MTTIRVRSDFARLARQFGDAADRQIPFAKALALTRTAKDVREAEQASLAQHFTIRSTWVKRGIQSRSATKAYPVAQVGSRDAFMARQVTGGAKRRPGGEVAIPVGARKDPTSKTTRSRWPGALAKRKSSYYTTLPSGARALMKRNRKGAGQVLYVFARQAVIKPRWPFLPIAERVIERRWPVRASEALTEAFAKAKKKA